MADWKPILQFTLGYTLSSFSRVILPFSQYYPVRKLHIDMKVPLGTSERSRGSYPPDKMAKFPHVT